MNFLPTVLERAFSLARSGDYGSVLEVRDQLKAEGFPLVQLEGPSLMRQLRDICIASTKVKAARVLGAGKGKP